MEEEEQEQACEDGEPGLFDAQTAGKADDGQLKDDGELCEAECVGGGGEGEERAWGRVKGDEGEMDGLDG